VTGAPQWFDTRNTLNVIGIRNNTEADFNMGKYDDILICIYNDDNNEFGSGYFECTVDPYGMKEGVAHLRQGMWNSYKVREHRGVKGRWALCQDKNVVELLRTDGGGNIIKSNGAANPFRGFFGINIHNRDKYNDPSLGCTVLKNNSSYKDIFVPYIYDVKRNKKVLANTNDVTYCLINHTKFQEYLDGKV
jgi:hypothetical protein